MTTGPRHILGCSHERNFLGDLPRKTASVKTADTLRVRPVDDDHEYIGKALDRADIFYETISWDGAEYEVEGVPPEDVERAIEVLQDDPDFDWAECVEREQVATRRQAKLTESDRLAIMEEAGEAGNLHKLDLEGTHYVDEDTNLDLILFTI